MTRLLLILFFLGNVANISAQKAFDNESRASYIFYIAKNVTWSNEEKFDDFKIGILAHDSSLYNALKNKSLKESSLKNKPLKIILFNKIETITPTQVLYVHQKSGFNIFEVSDKTWGNNTLIISENYP